MIKVVEMLKERGFFTTMIEGVKKGKMDENTVKLCLNLMLMDKDLQDPWAEGANNLAMKYIWFLIQKEADTDKQEADLDLEEKKDLLNALKEVINHLEDDLK